MFDANSAMLFLPLVLLVVMMIFMWRNNKKMQERQAQVRSEMTVGTEVMTQAGIYGTIVEVDPENSITTIESTPGTRLRVHTATVVNIVTPAVDVPDDASSLTASDEVELDVTDTDQPAPTYDNDETDPNAPKA